MAAKPPVPVDQELYAAMASRLAEASERWRKMGTFQVARGDSGGRDCLRMSRRLAALGSVMRSRRYRGLVPVKVLKDNWRLPAAELAGIIEGCMPGGKIPGYVDR